MKTNKKLNLLFDTLETRTGLTIGYHNVVSFLKYYNHLITDKWYSNCDVLIFSETQTISTDTISFPNFRLIERFDGFKNRKPRGLLIFAKPHVEIKLVKYSIEQTTQFHSTIAFFELNEFSFITGYKSPSTPFYIFRAQIAEILPNQNSDCIVIGDFNINVLKTPNSLSTFMNTSNYKNKMTIDDITTVTVNLCSPG